MTAQVYDVHSLDKLKSRAKRQSSDHRKPPPGLKLPSRAELIRICIERDGPLCQCGCGQKLDLKTKGAIEDEHKVALKDVAGLPDAERAYYFTPANRRLFVAGHQKPKSASEATRRAHMERAGKRHREHAERMARKYGGDQ